MSEIGYDLVKLLAVLAQGRSPILVPQAWVYGVANGPPVGLNDGVDVDGALLAKVGVRLRRSADKWRSYYRVDTATEAGEYGFLMLVNNVRVTAGAGETPATIIAALKAAADADLAFGPTWGGEATIVDGHTDVLEIAWPVEGYLVGQKYDDSGDGEAGASIISEATSAVWRLWGLPLGVDQWAVIREEPCRHATDAFELEDALARGWRRFYLEVLGADGLCLPFIGPARADTFAASLLEDAAVQVAEAEGQLLAGIPVGNDGVETIGVAALGQTGLAGGIKTQSLVSVNGDTELLPLDPSRKGYFIRNLGSAEVWLVNVTSAISAATNGHLELGADEAKAVSGSAAGNAVRATDNGAGPHNVWVESW